ncbi:ATP adenylyltransferase-domain-containing protein [Coniochaeta sp. 2T2.1]|nr:ATP adenylyltransferase-domain-containing protein [Coniochaeta sp. 2T2.1]
MSPPDSKMPGIQVPANLPALVKNAFNKARASGDLTYFPTQVTVLKVNSIPFQLRFSPSLANKPDNKPPPPPSSTTINPTKPFNPFANPTAALLVSPLPPSHNLVLNKFAVVPEHFILATSSFADQTCLLETADLDAARRCIDAYKREGRELFVFFNSGEHSGASQPHRHLQCLDVGMMREGLQQEEQGDKEWGVLAERLGDEKERRKLPFWTTAEKIDGKKGEELRGVYLRLYREAAAKMGVVDVGGQSEGEARISYNLAMTGDVMVVVPRSSEGGVVRGRDGEEVGQLQLNGTVLAGTALVKNEREWDALRNDPGQMREVLGRIGVPNEEGSG